MASIVFQKVSGDRKTAKYDLFIDNIRKMESVPIETIIQYFSNIHEDEPDGVEGE